eukprot:2012636-Rhodomonas_salina.1
MSRALLRITRDAETQRKSREEQATTDRDSDGPQRSAGLGMVGIRSPMLCSTCKRGRQGEGEILSEGTGEEGGREGRVTGVGEEVGEACRTARPPFRQQIGQAKKKTRRRDRLTLMALGNCTLFIREQFLLCTKPDITGLRSQLGARNEVEDELGVHAFAQHCVKVKVHKLASAILQLYTLSSGSVLWHDDALRGADMREAGVVGDASEVRSRLSSRREGSKLHAVHSQVRRRRGRCRREGESGVVVSACQCGVDGMGVGFRGLDVRPLV